VAPELTRLWSFERAGAPHRVELGGDSVWSGRPTLVVVDGVAIPLKWRQPHRLQAHWEATFDVGGRPAELVWRQKAIPLRDRVRAMARQGPRAFLVDLFWTLLSGSTAVGAGPGAASLDRSSLVITTSELFLDGVLIPGRPGSAVPPEVSLSDDALARACRALADRVRPDARDGPWAQFEPAARRAMSVEIAAEAGPILVARFPFGGGNSRRILLAAGWTIEPKDSGTRYYTRRFAADPGLPQEEVVATLHAAYEAVYGDRMRFDHWAIRSDRYGVARR